MVICPDGLQNMLVTICNANTIVVCSYEPVPFFLYDVLICFGALHMMT